MVVFVAAGFSLRRTGETPVPPIKVGRKIFDWSQLGISREVASLDEASNQATQGKPIILLKNSDDLKSILLS
jgi:hypothetical protein